MTSTKLLHIIMNDGSRHCFDFPATIDTQALVAHIKKLAGTNKISCISDGITEAWIDVDLAGHHFSINNQMGSYLFFVDDPRCPDDTLITLYDHIATLYT